MYMTIGVLLGLVVGTLPGLTATMGTALLVPFTFALPTGEGIAMLGGLYVCAMFSDAIPACLVNTPGTPAAMATGYAAKSLRNPESTRLRHKTTPPAQDCPNRVQTDQ